MPPFDREFFGGTDDIIPVTYMNSAASLKAFCGANGGVVCTSSNAEKVLEWAFERGKRVFFFPDQHLGRNTGHAMGIPLEEMVLWDWRAPAGSPRSAAVAVTNAGLCPRKVPLCSPGAHTSNSGLSNTSDSGSP